MGDGVATGGPRRGLIQDQARTLAPRAGTQAISGTLASLEQGFATGSAGLIAQYLAPDLRLRVESAPEGYYSANQATEILRHFFSGRTVTGFQFSKTETGEHPYAAGGLVYAAGGRQGRAQIYVGLGQRGGRWVVTQLSIH
jgi:hypothetical protein